MKFNFRNEADFAEIDIYDVIGDDGWEEGVTTDKIKESLEQAGGRPLNVYINSNGGDVFEGFAIYNQIKRYTGYTTVYVDGVAASIASVIALAGDKVVMSKASMFMIHNASSWCYGNAEEMEKVVQALISIDETIKDIYIAKTHLDRDTLTDLMNKETFLTAEEALSCGFADEIIDKEMTEEITNRTEVSYKLMKDTVEQRIKQLKDLKYLGESGVLKDVIEEPDTENKSSHWDWLKKGN